MLFLPANLNKAICTLQSKGALYLKGVIKNIFKSDIIRKDIIINNV